MAKKSFQEQVEHYAARLDAIGRDEALYLHR